MPIAGITGKGLSVIGLSVAFLWGCVIGERLLIRQARQEHARILIELRTLQQRRGVTPVSSPRLLVPHPVRPITG